MDRTMICGFCENYDQDRMWCPYEGEMFPEETCDKWTEDLSEEEREAQVQDGADRENHRRDVEGEIE